MHRQQCCYQYNPNRNELKTNNKLNNIILGIVFEFKVHVKIHKSGGSVAFIDELTVAAGIDPEDAVFHASRCGGINAYILKCVFHFDIKVIKILSYQSIYIFFILLFFFSES